MATPTTGAVSYTHLVFFNNGNSSKRATHVGIYIGGNQFVHASTPRQTHIPFHEMVADKGLCGEFLAYLYFSDLPVYNRVLMNAIIPRENGDFSEIDLICLTPGRIMVVESKNRGGRLRGNLSDPKWVQILPGCENPMGNPIMQNETHIFVLQNYINSHIGS